MKLLIDTFVTVFLITIAVLICSQLINVQLQVNDAKDYHAVSISMIEESDFDPAVIDKCKQDAINRNYQLLVEETKTEKLVCQDCNTLMGLTEVACPSCSGTDIYRYAKERLCIVELAYAARIPLLQIQREGVINGYAR